MKFIPISLTDHFAYWQIGRLEEYQRLVTSASVSRSSPDSDAHEKRKPTP
jgi:hypothetical protein